VVVVSLEFKPKKPERLCETEWVPFSKVIFLMATGNTNIDVTYLLNSGGEIKSDSLSIKTKNDLDVISG
jgi:hypothetical protein